MPNSIERALEAALTDRFHFGQVLVQKRNGGGFVALHRDDQGVARLEVFRDAEAAVEIAKRDDAGNYRPLKTAPNLRRGWRLELATLEELKRALDYLYPGRLAAFVAWKADRLRSTPLRETLNRQSGMYRVAAKISDEQISDLVAGFCRSDGGCLRTILWKRDQHGGVSSAKLPMEKLNPVCEQATALLGPGSSIPATIPLLCQEACNLLVAECRRVVKGEKEL